MAEIDDAAASPSLGTRIGHQNELHESITTILRQLLCIGTPCEGMYGIHAQTVQAGHTCAETCRAHRQQCCSLEVSQHSIVISTQGIMTSLQGAVRFLEKQVGTTLVPKLPLLLIL